MYNLKTYDSAADALQGQRDDNREVLAAIAEAYPKIGGVLRVYLPTAERVRQGAIYNNQNIKADVVSYTVTVLQRGFEFEATALKKRAAFDTVVVEKRFDAGDPPESDADYVLWVSLPEPGSAAWYFRRRGGLRELVPMDTGAPVGVPRMTAWLESVERLARGESRAGTSTRGEARSASPAGDTAERLRKLERLHDDGLITDEEYRKARGRALDKL